MILFLLPSSSEVLSTILSIQLYDFFFPVEMYPPEKRRLGHSLSVSVFKSEGLLHSLKIYNQNKTERFKMNINSNKGEVIIWYSYRYKMLDV